VITPNPSHPVKAVKPTKGKKKPDNVIQTKPPPGRFCIMHGGQASHGLQARVMHIDGIHTAEVR
jgi:hypothetical protein